MKLASTSRDVAYAEMSPFEIFVCRAALREVLYGFKFPDFEPRMGCTREEAAAIFDALPDPTDEEIEQSVPTTPPQAFVRNPRTPTA